MNLKIGSLYQYPATRRIELFDSPDKDSFIVDFLGLIEANEPFALLDYISLEDIWWRLKILTADGKIGWVTIQFINHLRESKSEENL